jgi:hypothetical protein
LPARAQDQRRLAAHQQRSDEVANSREYVLAVVQDHHRSLGLEELDNALQRTAIAALVHGQRRGNHTGDRSFVGHGGEFADVDPVGDVSCRRLQVP